MRYFKISNNGNPYYRVVDSSNGNILGYAKTKGGSAIWETENDAKKGVSGTPATPTTPPTTPTPPPVTTPDPGAPGGTTPTPPQVSGPGSAWDDPINTGSGGSKYLFHLFDKDGNTLWVMGRGSNSASAKKSATSYLNNKGYTFETKKKAEDAKVIETQTGTEGKTALGSNINSYIRDEKTGAIHFLGDMPPKERNAFIRSLEVKSGGGGFTWVSKEDYDVATTKVEKQEQDDFWNEWTELQQYIQSNPEIMEGLLEEVTIFDSWFDQLKTDLDTEKKLNLNEINTAYDETLKQIELNDKLSLEQKNEAIQNLTDDYFLTNEQLNYSRETAYKNASKMLTRAAEDVSEGAAAAYLQQVAGGVTAGNIAQLTAQDFTKALKRYREDVSDEYNQSQFEIEMSQRRAVKQLEQQVGTEEAQKIFQEAQKAEPFDIEGVQKYKSLELGGEAPKFGDYEGAIERGYRGQKEQAGLSKQFALTGKQQGIERIGFGAEKGQRGIRQQQKERELSYVSSIMQYLPYRKTTEGKFQIGQKAGETGRSFTQRNKWRNTLSPGAFRIY